MRDGIFTMKLKASGFLLAFPALYLLMEGTRINPGTLLALIVLAVAGLLVIWQLSGSRDKLPSTGDSSTAPIDPMHELALRFPSFSKGEGVLSFAQEGEDLVLCRLLQGFSKGFFVDVGAHHPSRFSNTYKFYLNGWRGLNIEPCPGTKALFDQVRPRDINLELGIGTESGSLTYHRFNEPALNTFDPEVALGREKQRPGEWHLLETVQIPVRPLSQVLEVYLPKDTKISFLTIDTEGFELQVLKSNDWEKFRPEFILSETFLEKIEQVTEIPEYQLLKSKNYSLIGKTHRTLFFRDQREAAKSDPTANQSNAI